MSDWSSLPGAGNRGGIVDGDSFLGGSMKGADFESFHGSMSARDLESLAAETRDHESNIILTAVADAIEQLRATGQEEEEKEKIVVHLSQLAESSVDARAAIGCHPQAVPLLVSLLRTGTLTSKTHAAATLGALCDEDELRIRVLLGGCIPPMLSLLKKGPKESQMVAAEAIFAVSRGGSSKDQIGAKIFSTEGVVPSLLQLLRHQYNIHPDVIGLIIGALRNLCVTVDSFWEIIEKDEAIEIFMNWLKTGKPYAQEHSAALLAAYLTHPLSSQNQQASAASALGGEQSMEEAELKAEQYAKKITDYGAIQPLLNLLEPGHDIPLRTEAAGAIRAISNFYREARDAITNAGGIGILIRATVAPSTEMIKTGYAQMLQENSMGALANIAGGKIEVVNSLSNAVKNCNTDKELADTIGALAYALLVLDGTPEEIASVNAVEIEESLVKRLSLEQSSPLVQERSIEALASLYGNPVVARSLTYAEAKRTLIGLITLSAPSGQIDLLESHLSLCSGQVDLWTALKGREGVLLLVALLGLSTEDQQEYATTLLYALTNENNESKWAITAAGGIPPLVQLLGIGTPRAREDAAAVLGNLCSYSEDIRACVETAEASSALLNLLTGGSIRGQAVSARALTRLVGRSSSSSAIISQLSTILVGDLPESKVHVLRVLGHLLVESVEVFLEGSAAHEALQTLISLLHSDREDTQESTAAVLANLFAAREDLRESRLALDAIPPMVRLVEYGSEHIAMQAARALAAIFCSIDTNYDAAQVAKETVYPLVKLAKSSATAVAEVATTALANLLANEELAQFAPAEEVILPLSRLLREGTAQGKEHAAGALAHLLHSRAFDAELAESIKQCSTVLALVALLAVSSGEEATMAALESLSALARAKVGNAPSPLQVLSEVPYSISPLVSVLSSGSPILQEKAIEVLSRLCKDQPVILGDLIAGTEGCISSLSSRIISSPSLEVKVGGTALLICSAKEHRENTIEAMIAAGMFENLVKCLVEMLAIRTSSCEEPTGESSAAILVSSVALWLLAVISCHESRCKKIVAEAGAIEVLTEKLSVYSPNAASMDEDLADDSSGSWVMALLLAILFSERDVARTPEATRLVPSLASLLRSEDISDRFFSAQALASLVTTGSRGTLLAVIHSGAESGLIMMLGNSEAETEHLAALSEDFSLCKNPEQVGLEKLFRCDDIRQGPTAIRTIPSLVALLKPMPEKPGSPPLALALLTQVAKGSNQNKLAMAEAGVLEALTKYLSLGPQEAIEEAAAELLRILFSSAELRMHTSAVGTVEQLVAVLKLGTRSARYSAACALEGLFMVEGIRLSEISHQAISPLIDMLKNGSEKEQRAAVAALIKLTNDNSSKIMAITEGESPVIESLVRILQSSSTSLLLKEESCELLCILFSLAKVRSSPIASSVIPPLVEMLKVDGPSLQYRSACALDNLLEEDLVPEKVAAAGAVIPLVHLLNVDSSVLHSASGSALLKLAKDRSLCKIDMVTAGVIESIVSILPSSPVPVISIFSELLRVLTNNSSIAKGLAAGKLIIPLLETLLRTDLTVSSQNSCLQTLVNVLEKPERLKSQSDIPPSIALSPMIHLLMSHSLVIQQLSVTLTAHLLSHESFQRDQTTQQVIMPLIKLLSTDIEILQRESLRALEHVAKIWPNSIADAHGIEELSRLISIAPQPLWQSAAFVLINLLQTQGNFHSRVPIPILIRLLLSNSEPIQQGAISALLALEKENPSKSEAMAELGVIDALLQLLRSHQVEESSARLLETLFNSGKVRSMPISQRAIPSLSSYLLDADSSDNSAKLLVSLALGDLFQDSNLAKSMDAAVACKALLNLFEVNLSEDLQMVAICGLQNLAANSKINKRAIAEAGGIQILLDLVPGTSYEITNQIASLISILFSNNSIQEYASPDIISAMASLLERELWKTASASDAVVRAIETLLQNFARLRSSEAATSAISVLVGSLKVGNERAQESAVNSLFVMRQEWTKSKDVGRGQAAAAAEAIPVLQLMLRSGPPRVHEKAEALLSVLPGSLSVNVKRGSNLKFSMGATNAYCKVMLGDAPPRRTKVVSQSASPEWKQIFSWPLDQPPRGRKIEISCKSKSTLGNSFLGKVEIPIDRVVTLGLINGTYTLQPENNRDGSPRTLDIELVWSYR